MPTAGYVAHSATAHDLLVPYEQDFARLQLAEIQEAIMKRRNRTFYLSAVAVFITFGALLAPALELHLGMGGVPAQTGQEDRQLEIRSCQQECAAPGAVSKLTAVQQGHGCGAFLLQCR